MKDSNEEVRFEDVTERLRAEGELRQTRASLMEARADAEKAAKQAQEAHERLREVFDLIPEGLALFDAQDRHLLWNRRYAQLNAGIVDPIVPGMSFDDLMRRGLALGRYPEAAGREEQWVLERRAMHAMPHSSHEQQLADGRWLRIEEHRTGDGGSVGVWCDNQSVARQQSQHSFAVHEILGAAEAYKGDGSDFSVGHVGWPEYSRLENTCHGSDKSAVLMTPNLNTYNDMAQLSLSKWGT